MAEVSVYDPSMLIWIDESRCDRQHVVGINKHILSEESHLWIIEFLFEEPTTQQFLSCQFMESMTSV